MLIFGRTETATTSESRRQVGLARDIQATNTGETDQILPLKGR